MAAHHSSIHTAPHIVTDSAPFLVPADLHSAIVERVSSLQTNLTSVTCCKLRVRITTFIVTLAWLGTKTSSHYICDREYSNARFLLFLFVSG